MPVIFGCFVAGLCVFKYAVFACVCVCVFLLQGCMHKSVCTDVCPTMLPLHLQKDRNTQPQAETSRSK